MSAGGGRSAHPLPACCPAHKTLLKKRETVRSHVHVAAENQNSRQDVTTVLINKADHSWCVVGTQHTSYHMYKPKPKPKTRRMIGLSEFDNLNLNLGNFYCKNTIF
jgi:hypothetical protein